MVYLPSYTNKQNKGRRFYKALVSESKCREIEPDFRFSVADALLELATIAEGISNRQCINVKCVKSETYQLECTMKHFDLFAIHVNWISSRFPSPGGFAIFENPNTEVICTSYVLQEAKDWAVRYFLSLAINNELIWFANVIKCQNDELK